MTHAYLGLLGLDLLLVAAGYGLLDGLGLMRFPTGALRYCGLAFFAGWAAVATVLSLAACAGLYPGARGTVILTAAVGVAGVGLRRGFPFSPRVSQVSQRHPLERLAGLAGLALVLIALGTATIVAAVSPADTSWDVWAKWLPKANAIYYFHGLDTGLSGFTTFADPNYPPLFPVVSAATFHLMGGVHPALLPLQQCLLGVAFVVSVVPMLIPHARPWILFPSLAMLSLAPEFWGRLPSVLPDQTVGYLLAAATVASALWLVERRRAWLALAVLFLAAAALTKTEGLMLGVILAIAVATGSLAVHQRRGLPALALALGPAAILPWRHWLEAHGQPVGSGDYRWHDLFDFDFLSSRTSRLDYAVDQLLHFVFYRSIWLLVVPLGIVACLMTLRAATALAVTLLVWLVAGFAGLAATYWIGAPEIHWYVETSGQRVIATLPLVAGTMLPLLLGLALGHGRRETS